MRVLALIAALWATGGAAASKGELFSASVDFARANCAAFSEHEKYWPGPDSILETIWRSTILRHDAKETAFAAPLAPAVLKNSAWAISRYSLMDEVVWIKVYADWKPAPPVGWYERYRRRSLSMAAAADVYECLRPTMEEIDAFKAEGGAPPDPGFVAVGDCYADIALKIARVFAGHAPDAVHPALQPLSAQIAACEGAT